MRSVMRRNTVVVSVLLALALLIHGHSMPTAAAMQKKLSLDEAKGQLDRAKSPVERTKAYIQISEVALKELSQSISAHDFDALNEWCTQYRQAISSARETMVTSGRDAQRDPEGYKDLEILLRQHINWMMNWKRKLADSRPIDESIVTANGIRKEMLDLLFPVIGDKPKG